MNLLRFLSPLWAFSPERRQGVFETLAGAFSRGWFTLGAAVIGGIASNQAAKKNAAAIRDAKPDPLDISKVISDARTAASENYARSIGLEQQFRPGTAALRTTTDQSLQALAAGQTPGLQARDSLLSSLGGSYATNPLLQESANRILGNLRLGGALGPDVQAQAMQAALQKGGAAGISGSGAARGLVARDLGLTSLGLEQQRIQQAQQAGTAMAQLNLQDLATRGNLITNAAAQDASRAGLLASIVDARALPESGLSPGAIANLYVGDKNAQDQFAVTSAAAQAQNRNATLNSLLGFGTMAASGAKNINWGGLFGGSPALGAGGGADPSNPWG